jgi:hypothetical protein
MPLYSIHWRDGAPVLDAEIKSSRLPWCPSRTMRKGHSAMEYPRVSELGAEKALRSYLRDRDEKIISVRIRGPTRSEAASLNHSSGKVKLLDLAT